MPKVRHQRVRDPYLRATLTPGRAREAAKSRYQQISEAAFQVGTVLYGIRTRDDLVKIGFTTKLWKRLGDYGINHLNVAHWLLFVVPGTYEEEQEIHLLLREYRERGEEYYRPADEVLEVVDAFRKRCGLDALAA